MTEKGARAVRRDLIRRGLILAAVGLLIAGLTVYSFGWFANNVSVTGNGLRIKPKADDYELAVLGDQALPFAADSNIVLYLQQSAVGGYQKRASTNNSNPAILCHMSNEHPHVENSEEIAPGAFGTVSFDIVVPTGSDYTGFDISLDYLPITSGAGGLTAVNPAVESEVLELLSGHILLFGSRTALQNGGHYYSDPIGDSLSVTLADYTPVTQADGDHYTVTFYWIWPGTFGQMAFPDGDSRVHSHTLFNDSTERAALLARMAAHPEQFFRSRDPLNPDRYVNGTELDLANPPSGYTFEDYYYVELSEGYNLGDQFVGDHVRYLVIVATVRSATAAP